eukprot:jgi/Chlat1/936/Chrsp108S01368
MAALLLSMSLGTSSAAFCTSAHIARGNIRRVVKLRNPVHCSAAGVAAAESPVDTTNARKPSPTSSYWKLLPFVQPQVGTILGAWACTAVAVISLLLVVPRVGQLSELLSAGNLGSLLHLSRITLLLVAARVTALYFQDIWLWEVALEVTNRVRQAVYGHVQSLDISFFESSGGRAGDLAYRLTTEAEHCGEMTNTFLRRFVPSAIQLVVMLGRMILPSMAVVIRQMGTQLQLLAKDGQAAVADVSAYLNEVLPGIAATKAHNAEAFELRKFASLTQRSQEARLAAERSRAIIPGAITAIYAITVVALFAIGAWAIARGSFSGGKMVAFITSLVLLIEPIQAVTDSYNILRQGEAAVDRTTDLLQEQAAVTDSPDAVPLSHAHGQVRFDNVSFRYPGSTMPALQGISLTVEPGMTVALVGPSGGGKSTVAKLLLRFYDPSTGVVQLDGHDLQRLTLQSIRSNISYIPQDTVLFSGTVAENIAYGAECDMSAVEQAARLANAHDFITKLTNGYETTLGAEGTTLSGGQRQRIAIARAIYRQPSILVLDEATSALDNRTEADVQAALARATAGRTVIVIAHRLETVVSADKIVYMDGGQIQEQGSHAELLAKDRLYAALYRRELSHADTQPGSLNRYHSRGRGASVVSLLHVVLATDMATDGQQLGAIINSAVVVYGQSQGPLHGLTFAVKDIFDVSGFDTGFGHPTWQRTHARAHTTAPTVQALLDAGANLNGKTVMDELAFALTGQNLHYGTPLNPAAPDRIPGGSSSGSASVVAAGEVDFALGTDTAGSVRGPASFCGLMGFRPTHDRITLDGTRPLAPSFDTVGWFAKDPAILQAVGNVLLGGDAFAQKPGKFFHRWLVAADAFEVADKSTSKAIYDALSAHFQELIELVGPPIDTRVAPDSLAAWTADFRTLQLREVWLCHKDWITEHEPEFGPDVKERFEAASRVTAEAAKVAKQKRIEMTEHMASLLRNDAVLAIPTSPGPAPKLTASAEEMNDYRARQLQLTGIASLAGLPEVTLPIARVDGCPVGLSFIGPKGSDEELLSFAVEVMRILQPGLVVLK